MNPKSKRLPDEIKRLNRLLSILRMLDRCEALNPDIYAKKYGIDIRNLYRDIKDLKRAGFDIKHVKFENGDSIYRFADPDFSLRDLSLSKKELMALLFGRQLAHRLGKPLENGFNSLLKKAHTETGAETGLRADRLQKGKQNLWVAIDPINDFEKIEGCYNTINKAIDDKLMLEITYHGMKSQSVSQRQVAPYGLFYGSGMWYMVARCYREKDIRTFALDCIQGIKKLTGRHFLMPSDFDIESYLQKGWRIVRYGRPVEVILKFSKDVARWIKRKKWHPTQSIEEQKDGSLILKVKLTGPEEIKRWSYNWAPYCEILSPPELRKEAAEEIKAEDIL